MKTLALFSLSLAVALGMPPFAPGVAQNPVLTDEKQSPLVGDWVPVQGHVVEDPAPQVRLDMEQSTGELEIKVKPQVREEPEGEVMKKEQMFRPDVKAESEVEPEVKVESEVKKEPDAQEEFLAQMNLEAETATGREIEERHIDMEGKYEVVGGTNMELEPLDDELSEVEKSVRATFQNQSPVHQHLPGGEEEEEGELMRENDSVLDGEPIMELEPLDDDNMELSVVEKSLRKDPINQPLLEEGLMRENDNTEPEVEPQVKVALEVKVEPDVKEEFLVQMGLEAETATGRAIEERHIDMEGKYEVVGETNVELEPLDDDNMELSEVEKSLRKDPINQPLLEEGLMRENDNTEPEVEPEVKALEVKVEPDVKEEFQVQMSLEAETATGREIEERHIDMEGKYEVVGETNVELEPLDDELSEVEKSVRATFQNQSPVHQHLPGGEEEEEEEEEGELMRENYIVLDGEPIMELEPLDDDNTELSEEEKSLRKGPINQPLLEEGLMRENDNAESEVEPEVKVESEVKKEPDAQEEFQVQMSLEAETATGREIEERHIDMEGKYEVVGGTNMELEPLDDELSEVEKSVRATFQNQSPVHQHLPGEEEEEEEEEEELMRENDSVLDGEPIMELEPLDDDNMELSGEQEEEAFLHQQVMPDTTIMEERPSLDMTGQQMPSLEEYRPKEEAGMVDYLMVDEPGRFVREEELFEEMGDGTVLNGGVQVFPEERRLSPNQDKQGWSHCPGVTLEGKCYQFFKGPKSAADAEFFCQEQFAGGHLASITNTHIHRELLKMMQQQSGGHTRTWIGGLRYLETGRFIWLDGSHWSYADWLSGRPIGNTADSDGCVEVLAHENGKFNNSACWERQAFICSHPY